MKKIFTKNRKNILKALGIFWLLANTFSIHAEITVIIKGAKNVKGKIMIALYEQSGYLNPSKMVAKTMTNASAKKVVKFTNIKPGRYAIAVFHDENLNQKLDTNFLGMPQEGYGFSNYAKGNMGPPNFSDSSFYYDGKKTTQKIKLEY